MTKILNFFKKYWFLILITLTIILWSVNTFLIPTNKNSKVNPTSTPNTSVATYKSIAPGVSQESDIQQNLGTALKIQKSGIATIFDYNSNNKYRNTQIQSENGGVVFIKEIIAFGDNRSSSEIVNVYGQAKNILYGSSLNSVFNLYVYPQNGIAYIGSADGTMTEIWYFQPTTIEDFISRWAPNYSLKPPTIENQGY